MPCISYLSLCYNYYIYANIWNGIQCSQSGWRIDDKCTNLVDIYLVRGYGAHALHVFSAPTVFCTKLDCLHDHSYFVHETFGFPHQDHNTVWKVSTLSLPFYSNLTQFISYSASPTIGVNFYTTPFVKFFQRKTYFKKSLYLWSYLHFVIFVTSN